MERGLCEQHEIVIDASPVVVQSRIIHNSRSRREIDSKIPVILGSYRVCRAWSCIHSDQSVHGVLVVQEVVS